MRFIVENTLAHHASTLLTWPRSTHTSTTETKDNFLPSGSPLIHQRLIISILTNWHCRCNVTLRITIILRCSPRVRHGKSNDNVRIGIDLSGSRTGLPIANVGNETWIFSMIGVVVETTGGRSGSCWWSRSWRRGSRSTGAWSILTAGAAVVGGLVGGDVLSVKHINKVKKSNKKLILIN